MEEQIGRHIECIKKYFDDPLDIRYCTTEGVPDVCKRDCGVYKSRRIEGLRGTDVPAKSR